MTSCNQPSLEQRLNDPWGLQCNPVFQLGGESASDSNIIETYITEHLKMGAANANVFKLLGVHEQGKYVDPNGVGSAISSGEVASLPASDVFEKYPCVGWKSTQKGDQVVAKSFIGYDFGPLRSCERTIYGVDTKNTYLVTEIVLQQGKQKQNRCSKIRVERSDDGKTWFGVDIINAIDTENEVTYKIRQTVPSRFWRLRPIEFNGLAADSWQVLKFHLSNRQTTRLDTLQDEMGYLESRDRDYSSESVQIKMYYDIVDTKTQLSKIGIDTSDFPYSFLVGFLDAIRLLGRPFVIGDIIELPNEVQYTPTLKPVKKYLEVTDVTWATEGYTPNWRPTLQRVSAAPLIASQETLDVIDGHHRAKDPMGFVDMDNSQVQDFTDVSHRIFQQAEQNVPERGSDTFNIAEITDDVEQQINDQLPVNVQPKRFNINPKGLYVEDALPPNGLPYTEGDAFPPTPADGAYHRLTYKNNANDNIPPRLFKYSLVKGRWIYCETDRRKQYNRMKPSLQANITSPTATSNDKIMR